MRWTLPKKVQKECPTAGRSLFGDEASGFRDEMKRKGEGPAQKAANRPGTRPWRPVFQHKTPLEGSGSLYRFNTVNRGYRFLNSPESPNQGKKLDALTVRSSRIPGYFSPASGRRSHRSSRENASWLHPCARLPTTSRKCIFPVGSPARTIRPSRWLARAMAATSRVKSMA